MVRLVVNLIESVTPGKKTRYFLIYYKMYFNIITYNDESVEYNHTYDSKYISCL